MSRLGGFRGRLVCATATAAAVPALVVGGGQAQAPEAPVWGHVLSLAGSSGSSESRNTVTPDGRLWVNTNATDGTSVVYGSADGGAAWKRTASDPSNQTAATTDVDIVSTHTGRLVSTELDDGGINFRTSYSDDGGTTWTTSTGTEYADTDRPWLAVGPDDATTHQPRVYLLFHDLLSGTVQHNMFVATSTDGGATFGAPVPITLPPQQAYLDLQCADSGGPSNITVNPRTGQIYAIFGTRSSPAGGCGASVTGSFEINVVAATRVWVATSMDGSLGSWTQSLAVDDNATGQIVGMQLAPGALDTAGNLYVAYPESPNAYPDYDGAAIRVTHAPADLSAWSKPVTVAAGGGAGNVLPHIIAGDPGRYDVAYWHGVDRPGNGNGPAWYETSTFVTDGLSAAPDMVVQRLSDVVVQAGTASLLMGACGSGPAQGVENGFACGRSADVWGIAEDAHGYVNLSWPAQSPEKGAVNTTFVAVQTGGPSLLAPTTTATTGAAGPSGGSTGGTQGITALANTAAAAPSAVAAVLPLGGLVLLARRRRRRATGS